MVSDSKTTDLTTVYDMNVVDYYNVISNLFKNSDNLCKIEDNTKCSFPISSKEVMVPKSTIKSAEDNS